jgi:predicted nucleic acid-binding protein
MPWIIDTDIFIEGERGNVAFVAWLQSADGIATADVVRGEFLIGAHAVADEPFVKEAFSFTQNGLPAYRPFLPNRPIMPKLPRWLGRRAVAPKANLD